MESQAHLEERLASARTTGDPVQIAAALDVLSKLTNKSISAIAASSTSRSAGAPWERATKRRRSIGCIDVHPTQVQNLATRRPSVIEGGWRATFRPR